MDRSLYFIDFLPLFFLLLFTFCYNQYIDIPRDDEEEYISKSQVESQEELNEKDKLNIEFKNIVEYYDELKLYEDKSCDIDNFGIDGFWLAVKANNVKLAKYFFEHNKFDINQKNDEGENALLLCDYGSNDIAEYYHYEKPDMVEFLIDNGVEVNVKDKEGNTPLIKACNGNNISIIRKLLKAGAKVNVKNNKGETPIIVVAKNNGLSLVLPMLVEAGADINERNEYGENIITAALRSERHFWQYIQIGKHIFTIIFLQDYIIKLRNYY